MEPAGPLALDRLQQCASDAVALPFALHVQMTEQVVLERGESDDLVPHVCSPDLVTRSHLGTDPRSDLVVRVDDRQEGQSAERRQEDVGDCVGLVLGRKSDDHAS